MKVIAIALAAVLTAVAIAICLLAPGYYAYLLGTLATTALVGVGLNVLLGLSGEVSLGQGGFMALGAYGVAILTTKISLYLGTSPLPAPAAPPKEGMWAVLHESRSDWAQLVCCLFLVLVGAGAMSIDARWRHTQVARA